MEGRILTVKKSTWLIVSLVFNFLLFLGMSIVSFIYTKNINSAFFFFCIATGIHQIIKSILFKFDSSCFLGTMLFLIGLFYFFADMFDIFWLYPVFIVVSIVFSSMTVGIYFDQPFQIFLSFSLYFVGIGLLFFLLKIFSIWIFVAICVVSVLLLIIRFLTL